MNAAILKSPDANGLAVIIVNDYMGTDLGELVAPPKDGVKLFKAFTDLNFAVCYIPNADKNKMDTTLDDLCCLPFKESYRCIFFIFHGHGGHGSYIHTPDGTCGIGDIILLHDGSEYKICDPINRLLPKHAISIGSIPKVFLIHACRGQHEAVASTQFCPAPYLERAAMGMQEVSEVGEWMLVQTTLPMQIANATTDGAYWLSILSDELLKERTARLPRSIEDLFTDTNKEMLLKVNKDHIKFQQTERWTRVNKRIYLSPNCSRKYHDVKGNVS